MLISVSSNEMSNGVNLYLYMLLYVITFTSLHAAFNDPPTTATTEEVTTDLPTTEVVVPTPPPGNTEVQVNTNGQTVETTDLNSNSASPGSDPGAAVAAVIIVLLLVLGVAIGITVFFVCYAKRKHGSIKGCLKSSNSRFSAIGKISDVK